MNKTDFNQFPTYENVRSVSPALARYTQDILFEKLWNRADLNKKDRSLVSLAVLIARNQLIELSIYLDLALKNNVTPSEISELITHLAFYSGWGNAMSAISVAKEVFHFHNFSVDQLPPALVDLLQINQEAEDIRAATVEKNVGSVSPGIVEFTDEVLFHDLWLRPDLAPRDRSLVTVSALIASGHVAQIPYHLNRAMDNGLSKSETSEVLTHVAFYAGWPFVFSAIPVVKDVFEKRSV